MTFFVIVLYYIINGDLMQRFKPKRRLKKIAILKLILFIIFMILIFNAIKLIRINLSSEFLLKIAMSDKRYQYKNKTDTNIFSKAYNYAKENIINKPETMLVGNMKYVSNNKVKNKTSLKNENKKTKENTYVNNMDDATIYIYSSHQKESYSMDYMEDYNVEADVLLASHIMQEKLEKIGIKTIVLEEDITKYLNDNSLDYSYSYVASRYYLKEDMNKYPNIKLYIDLHRDAAKKEATTTTINDKKCAKIMFVIGREYDTYKNNLSVANKLNEKITKLYPDLSRGILEKSGEGVNGIYNQDLGSNIILLELGGNNNNLDEVINTIELIVPIIGEYINET